MTDATDSLASIFPAAPKIVLDQVRSLRIRVRGWRYLEQVYGNTDEVIAVLDDLEKKRGRVYTDLPHFVYACLMEKDGKSPLSLDQIDELIEEGANLTLWRLAVSEAVMLFFQPGIRGSGSAQAGPGPGNGPTGS